MRGRMGRPGLMGTMARTAVIAGTATAVSGNVQRRGAARAAGQQNAAAEQQAQQAMAAPVAAPAMAPDDRYAKLKELGEMMTAGLLTEAEFASEKAKILAS